MLASKPQIYTRSALLFHHSIHTWHYSCNIIFHNVLARVECCSSKVMYRIHSSMITSLLDYFSMPMWWNKCSAFFVQIKQENNKLGKIIFIKFPTKNLRILIQKNMRDIIFHTWLHAYANILYENFSLIYLFINAKE